MKKNVGTNNALISKSWYTRLCERKAKTLGYAMFIIGLFVLSSCKKQDQHGSIGEAHQLFTENGNTLLQYTGLPAQTMWELQQARAATARYRNIRNAIQDGYEDIEVVVPGMGHHYRKLDLVDETFDVKKPEILVYNRNHDGSFELVAVEYAIPIAVTPNQAPQGFTGDHDVWDRNEAFGLWLLHAWVWTYNPLGIFNATNPLVHTH